jgi:small subunit ribosomal protein S6
MAFYEHVFLMRQDLAPAQVEGIIEQMKELVVNNGGKVGKVENWGLRTLAYKIRKNRKAHYVLMNLDAPASAIQELERIERLSDDVIRYMTIRVDELEEGPSAMMRAREERGRGGFRGNRGGSRDRGPRRDARPATTEKKED